MRELAKKQEVLEVIDKLTNTLQELKTIQEKNNLAYFIHQIIEEGEINTKNCNSITWWQLQGKKDLFINI